MTTPLRLVCADLEAPPLFRRMVDGRREGYEPDVGLLLAEHLDRELVWVTRPWAGMIPAVLAGEGDAVLCGQGITVERRRVTDFTRPYAIFDESVLVRAGAGITGPDDLVGRRVAAIDGSTNLRLAETLTGAVPVPFGGGTDDVFAEMVGALRAGTVDAVVDDDVALLPLGADPELEVAFTVATRNRWGLAVAKDRPDRRDELDDGLAAAMASGALAATWARWMPGLRYPFPEEMPS